MPTPFAEISKLNFKDQAIWFLNGFWEEEASEQAETIWEITQKFVFLDKDTNFLLKPDQFVEGANSDLNEFDSHRLLESFEETMTVVDMREAFKSIDQDSNSRMSVVEYLMWKNTKTIDQIERAPQGEDRERLEAAQKMMDEVTAALAEVTQKLEQQQAALATNKENLAAAEIALKAAAEAEEAVKAAEKELQQAVDELHKEEEAYKQAIQACDDKIKDKSLGVVSKNKAKNEKAQLLAEDPLPLSKAKITQEAALRKVTKQREVCEAATIEAERVQKQLEESKISLEKAVAELEAAYTELGNKMQEAERELQAAKEKGGVPYGAVWWMERELFEADKRLPNKRQKYDHSKPFEFSP